MNKLGIIFSLLMLSLQSCDKNRGLHNERMQRALQMATQATTQEDYPTAIIELRNCLSQLPSAMRQDTPTDKIYHKLGVYYQIWGRRQTSNSFRYADSSMECYEWALDIRQRKLRNHWLTSKTLQNIGTLFKDYHQNYVKAQIYFEKSLFTTHTDTTQMNETAQYLNGELSYNLSTALERLGEYTLAKIYGLRADSIYKALGVLAEADNSKDFKNYINNLLNLGDIYLAFGEPMAISYYNQVTELAKQYDIPKEALLTAYLNRGVARRASKHFELALADLEKAYHFAESSHNQAHTQIEFAKLYYEKRQYQLAENACLKSLEGYKHYPTGHPIFSELYLVLGQIYLKTNPLEKAKKAFQQAAGTSFGNIPFTPWQLEAIQQLADLQPDKLKISDEYEKLCQRLYERRVFLKTSAAKLNLTQQARTIFDKSIAVNHDLFQQTKKIRYLNRMLNDMEQSKAVLFAEQLHQTHLRRYAGLPDSIQQKERLLQLNIAQMERLLSENSDKFEQNQQKLLESHRNWQSFTADLQRQYPKYFQFKHQSPPQYDVLQIQKKLPDATGFMSYYWHQNTLHVLAIDHSIIKSYQITLDKSFDTAYQRYQKLVPLERWDKHQHQLFSESAYYLYQQLLERPLRDFSSATKTLSILPDDKLSNLNFASLLTAKHNISDIESPKSYLCQTYATQFAYNLADLGILHPQPSVKTRYQYAGFSHDFKNISAKVAQTKGYEALESSKKHIMEVVRGFGKGGYANTQMNLATFRDYLSQSKVIELVSHGSYDEVNRQSALAFPKGDSVEWLDINHIYEFDLAANELMALIACETGKGTVLKGETLISMAYAFGYSGSRRRLSAFWSIPHRNSMQLMDIFFQNLHQSKHPALALRQAQIKFLQDKSVNEQIPYYWAGLVPSGNLLPISD